MTERETIQRIEVVLRVMCDAVMDYIEWLQRPSTVRKPTLYSVGGQWFAKWRSESLWNDTVVEGSGGTAEAAMLDFDAKWQGETEKGRWGTNGPLIKPWQPVCPICHSEGKIAGRIKADNGQEFVDYFCEEHRRYWTVRA